MEPTRTFKPGGLPTELVPLCSPVVSKQLHERVAKLIERVGIPLIPGSKQHGERAPCLLDAAAHHRSFTNGT